MGRTPTSTTAYFEQEVTVTNTSTNFKLNARTSLLRPTAGTATGNVRLEVWTGDRDLGLLLMRRLTLLTLLMVACGGGVSVGNLPEAPTIQAAPAHWGECPPHAQGSGVGIAASLSSIFGVHDWIELQHPEAKRALEAGVVRPQDEYAMRISVEGGILRSGTVVPPSIDLADQIGDHLREAVALDADLLIGYPVGGAEFLGGTGVVIALLPRSDQAVFLGICTEQASSELARVATASGLGSVVDFVRRVVDPTSPEAAFLLEATAPPTTLSWEGKDAGLRLLSVADGAPQELLDQLVVVPVLVVVPSGWNHLALGVCFKLSVGWHDGCMPTSPDPLVHIINVLAVPGEPVEVWLLADPAILDNPIAAIATLDPALIAEVVESLTPPAPGYVPPAGMAFELTLVGDPISIAQVQDRVATGAHLSEVRLISLEEAEARMVATLPEGVPTDEP